MTMIALPVPLYFLFCISKNNKDTSYNPHACLAPVFNIEVWPEGLNGKRRGLYALVI